MSPRVDVISLGGTIAMTRDRAGGIVPTLAADDLLRDVPAAAAVELSAVEYRSLPGAHLSLSDIVDLAAVVRAAFERGVDGVVVTQGTDTIEETAYALDLLLDVTQPVIVTGAMRAPESPGADGPANVEAAIRVAASRSSRGRGVMVAFNDQIHAARWVSKTHTSRLDAFQSPDAGPLGAIREGCVRWFWAATRSLTINVPDGAALPLVPLVSTWLGDDAVLLETALGLQPGALVVEALGAGHVPTALIEPLTRACAAIPIVLTSCVGSGPVFRGTYGFPGSERDLLSRGLIWGGSTPGRKARILAALALAAGWSREEIATALALDEGLPA